MVSKHLPVSRARTQVKPTVTDNLVKVVWFLNSPDRADRYRVVGYYPLEGYGQRQIDDLATLGSSEFRRRLEGIYSRQREFTGPGRRAILTPPEL